MYYCCVSLLWMLCLHLLHPPPHFLSLLKLNMVLQNDFLRPNPWSFLTLKSSTRSITQLHFCLPSSLLLTLPSSPLSLSLSPPLCFSLPLYINLPDFLRWVTCLSISDGFSLPSVPVFFIYFFASLLSHTQILCPKGCDCGLHLPVARHSLHTANHPSHALCKQGIRVPPSN